MVGTAILWAAASLLIGGAAAIVSRSLRHASRAELEEACRRRKSEHLAREVPPAQQSVALGAECLHAIASALFLTALATLIASWPAADAWSGWARFTLAATLGGLALVAVGVWIPAAIVRVWGVTFVLATWPVWRAVTRMLTPLVSAGQQVEFAVQRAAGNGHASAGEQANDPDARAFLADGHRDGVLEDDAREMIEGVIQLGDAEVSQVMTPRTYMLSMRVSLSFAEAVKFVISSGHSRIPVYDKNRDDVKGILHMKDLLPELMKPGEQRPANVAGLLRPAQFVPETKRLDELLQEFQQTRNHMAMVLDEFGGVSGLVTLEDVLEEIVGEIVDEYDDALVEEIKSIDDRTAEALARVRIDEVNERLGTHLAEDGDFDTIGGFLFSHLGHIPAVGESVTVDDARLTVIDVTRRRIERVRIEVLDPTRA